MKYGKKIKFFLDAEKKGVKINALKTFVKLNDIENFWLNALFLLTKNFSLTETYSYCQIFGLNEDEKEELFYYLQMFFSSNNEVQETTIRRG